jgi:hypothetical protein
MRAGGIQAGWRRLVPHHQRVQVTRANEWNEEYNGGKNHDYGDDRGNDYSNCLLLH